MGFSRQGYWSGLPFPSPWDLPNPGIEPGSPALQADSPPTELQGKPLMNLYAMCKSCLGQAFCVSHPLPAPALLPLGHKHVQSLCPLRKVEKTVVFANIDNTVLLELVF